MRKDLASKADRPVFAGKQYHIELAEGDIPKTRPSDSVYIVASAEMM